MNNIKFVAFAAVVYLLCHSSHATTKRDNSQYWVDHVDCERYPDPDMCKMLRSATQFLLAEPESEPSDARVGHVRQAGVIWQRGRSADQSRGADGVGYVFRDGWHP
jgi:hypothetical protein